MLIPENKVSLQYIINTQGCKIYYSKMYYSVQIQEYNDTENKC